MLNVPLNSPLCSAGLYQSKFVSALTDPHLTQLPLVSDRQPIFVPSRVHRHSTKKFPRWLNGSCIEAQPQQVTGQDEAVLFSFSDVSMHPAVNEVALGVQEGIRGGVASLLKHISWWKKYRLLWKMQRVGVGVCGCGCV